jgi:Ca2+-binding EF-hand superfamily protein
VALGLEEQAQKVVGLLRAALGEGSRELDFAGFLGLFAGQGGREDWARRMFREYDQEGKGFVTEQDFRRVCERLHERCSEEEVRAMLQSADLDRDGRLSFEEFERVVRKYEREGGR